MPGRALRRRRAGRDLRRGARAPARAHRRRAASTRSSTSRSTARARRTPRSSRSTRWIPVRGGVTHVDLHEVRLDQPISAVGLRRSCSAATTRRACARAACSRSRCARSRSRRCRSRCRSTSTSTSRGMEIGATLRISDLTAPEGVTLLDDPEMVVATVTAPTKVVEPEPTEEELAARRPRARRGAEGEAEGAERRGDAAGDRHRRRAESSGGEDPAAGVVARPARRRSRATRAASTRGTGTTPAGWSWTSSRAGTAAPGAAKFAGQLAEIRVDDQRARAAEARDVHERLRPLGRARGARSSSWSRTRCSSSTTRATSISAASS